jgi:MEMO1 family protein
MGLFNSVAGQNARTRKPAVAGQFYPGNPHELKRDIESYLSHARKLASPPQMLISPHAGYVFSGPVAAMGYGTIDKKITTVILIGPPHHALFSGISILDVDSFETPLGRVPLAAQIIKKLRESSMVQSAPQADLPEHSVEVQIPFLQTVLPSFSIVPILTGRVNPSDVADLLLPYVNATTLVVASSDFSHYLSNAQARATDDASIKAILSGDENGDIEACGELPIRVVMHMAKKLSLSPQLLDARTSFDTAPQFGSDDRVVGYASIAYVKKAVKSEKK